MAVELIDRRLIVALQEGRSVITSQHTQARYLRYAYAHYQKAQGTDAWMTPRILTWNDWVLSLAREVMWSGYKSTSGQRSLLNPSQEQLVWEQILSQHSGGRLMDNLSSTAAVARRAWGLIQAWRLPDPKTAQFPNSDVRAFSGWMKRYFETSSKNHWLDSARLADSVSPAIRAGAITPPDKVILFGFDKFTPQQRVLLKTLENLGSGFKLLKQKKIKGKLSRTGFANFETELDAAARWARMQLAQDNPGVTAILIPDLDQRFEQVKRIFDEVLSPGSALPSSSLAGRPYTLSIDRKFSRNKLVLGAQSILWHVLQESFFAEVSSFLRSPFTRAAGAEQPMRARFELWLRQNNIDTLRPGELESLLDLYAQRHDTDAANSVFHSLLRGVKPLSIKGQGKHPLYFWASLFRDILNAVGWPGDFPLNVIELQAVEKFRNLFDELAALDFLVPVCDSGQALRQLGRIIRSTIFRPVLPEMPVQIMQPENAFGLRFDQTWVAGWHSQNWPQAPRSNPFLPIEWQRQYGLPGSSGELQLQHAIALTEDLCGSAEQVIFSHPQSSNEEPLSESPLIRSVPAALESGVGSAEVTDYCEAIRAATDLEEFNDSKGPQLENVNFARGGSTIFKLQSQCPFKAFAELRLGARQWNVPRPGVSALDRGIHLHKAMEFVWVKIDNSETLAKVISTEHLEVQVYQEVELALDYQDRKRLRKLSTEMRNLEQQRLVRQVRGILEMEAERPPFEVISHEEQRKLHLGGLSIEIRIDRVDHVKDKGLVLIDYKLGESTPALWNQPRMEEPQLPLYAQAYEEEVAAIAFINGKPGAIGMRGLGNSTDIAKGVGVYELSTMGKREGRDWPEQLTAWKEELEHTAGSYIEGEARVDPVSQNACRYCDLKTLCRVSPRRLKDGLAHE